MWHTEARVFREHTAARPEQKFLVEVGSHGHRKDLVPLGLEQSELDRYDIVVLSSPSTCHCACNNTAVVGSLVSALHLARRWPT